MNNETLKLIQIELKNKMSQVVNKFVDILTEIRVGRANPSILNHIKINYYDSWTPINQIASISMPEAQIMIIKPYDLTSIKLITAAINKGNLGVNVSKEANLIRLTFPKLNESIRLQVIQKLHKETEKFRIQIRNIRRHIKQGLKKNHDISENEIKIYDQEIQESTDNYIDEINKLSLKKEKELKTI